MREAFGTANLEWKRGIDWDAVRAFRLARAREAMRESLAPAAGRHGERAVK